MANRVGISTTEFRFSHGKEPRGYGLWWFEIDGESVSYTGKYAVAKDSAVRYAVTKNASVVKVLP